jgi:hypothetical protein
MPQPTDRYIPPPRVRDGGKTRYTQPVKGMAADREEERVPPPRVRPTAEALWERGKDVEELVR